MTGPEELKAWRERTGRTSTEASLYLGFSTPYYSKLENGRSRPGRDRAIHIKLKTGISIESWANDVVKPRTTEPVESGKRRVAKGLTGICPG